MTLTDTLGGFQGHVIFEVGYLQKVRLKDNITIEH